MQTDEIMIAAQWQARIARTLGVDTRQLPKNAKPTLLVSTRSNRGSISLPTIQLPAAPPTNTTTVTSSSSRNTPPPPPPQSAKPKRALRCLDNYRSETYKVDAILKGLRLTVYLHPR